MMDRVERLREAGNDSMNHDCMYTPELLGAADEIERLRVALQEIFDSEYGGDYAACQQCCHKEDIAEKALKQSENDN